MHDLTCTSVLPVLREMVVWKPKVADTCQQWCLAVQASHLV